MFKQAILGTALGHGALVARNSLGLLYDWMRHPEAIPAHLNDSLATLLITRLPCRTFVDVGAHLGSVFSEVLRRQDAKVIAIEAMPDKAAALRRKFPAVTVHPCAVGDDSRNVSFFVVPAASGYSSLVRNPKSVEITVPLRRLVDLINEPVDLMKIDVEGAELGVLRGAERVIAESRPVIMLESAPGETMYTKGAMWDWCTAHRYEVVVPDRVAHNGPALGRDGFAESHWYPRRTTNYFAIPAERREATRLAAAVVLNRAPAHITAPRSASAGSG